MTPLQQYIYSLQSVLRSSPDRIFMCWPNGKMICVNEEFCKFIGKEDSALKKISVDKLIGKNEWKNVAAELKTHQVLEKPIQFLKDTKKSASTYIFDLKYGDEVEARIFVMPLFSKSELVKIKQNKEDPFLKTLNGRAESAWFMADLIRGKYLFTSDGYTKLFGWPVEFFQNAAGAFFLSLIHPDDMKSLFDHYGEWLMMKNKFGKLYEHVPFLHVFRMKDINGNYVLTETEVNVLKHDKQDEPAVLLGSYRFVPASSPTHALPPEPASNIRIIDGKSYVDIDHVNDLGLNHTEAATANKFKGLSSREAETLKLIIDGLSSEEISKRLFISIHTVNMHRKQVLKKLGAKNLAELIRIYYTSL